MEGYLSGLLRPPPVPGGGHPSGHPGPPLAPPPPSPGPPRPPIIPGLPGYSGPGLALPGSLGLPPSHPYSSLYTDPLHAELLAREAHRAAELRLVESQRMESLRQAEARASSFLSPFSKDGLTSLVPGGHPYSDQLRFSMGSLYPPANPLLPPAPPSDLYLPPPVTSPHLFTPRPEVSPGGLARSRERERASSPAVRQGPANNSLLSDKLRLGFGVERERERQPHTGEGNIKRETGVSILQEGFRKPAGSLAVTHTSSSSSSSSSLVSSSHSGLNYPGSHPSASPWRSSQPKVEDDKNDEIQIIEDSDEEVLVDDFDGQCCRTFPYNHSRIQRWAEERRKKKEGDDIKEVATGRHSLENVQNIKIPTSCFDKSVVGPGPGPSESITTTAGSIPVGIVSARQRTETEKAPSSQPPVSSTPTSSACSSGLRTSVPELSAMPLPPSGPLVSTNHGIGPSTWSSGPPPPWPPSPAGPPPPPPPSYGSPWSVPPVPPPGMGPIPMGYQLAKDPMTGQILLIPTDSSQRPPSLWPGFEVPPAAMPATSSASQHLHHHMMLQQQQHLQYIQHQDLLQHQMRQAPPPQKTARQVPETITVSDDEEDSAPPPVTSQPSQPALMRVKPENLKTEVKVEVGEAETFQGPERPPVKDTPADLSVNIKKERSSVSYEDVQTEAGTENQPELKAEIKSEPETVTISAPSDESQQCAEILLTMAEFSQTRNVQSSETSQHTSEQTSDHQAEPQSPSQSASGNENIGFDVLLQGLKLLTSEGKVETEETISSSSSLDVLCNVTRNDIFEYELSSDILNNDRMDLGLLCSITEGEYSQYKTAVDPILKLKTEYNVFKYWNEEMEREASNFIAEKIKQFTKDHPESVEEEKYDNIKSLAKMVKKIKNMEIMSQLEVDLRLGITELQNKFREKQKSLAKLKTPRKKNLRNKKGKQRGPGRPKKKKFPNPKSKMGRPRKHPKVEVKPEPPLELQLETKVKLEEEVEDEEEVEEEEEEEETKLKVEEEESFPDSDAPPVLEPQQKISRGPAEIDFETFRAHGGLLKPPTLTASSSPPTVRESQVDNNCNISEQRLSSTATSTTLSTLTSKFMKGKANPFANLLSKLNSSGPTEVTPAARQLEPEPQLVTEPERTERSSSEKSSDESSCETYDGNMMSPTRDTSFKFGKTSKLSYGLEAYRHIKKRKSEKPKKHCGGSSETIVPKKPKNLFMMMDFQRGFSSKTAEDQYNFDEHEEEEFSQRPSFEYREPRKSSPTPSGKSQESHYQDWTDDDLHSSPRRKHKKAKVMKTKTAKTERSPGLCEEDVEPLRSAQLHGGDLKDGLRMLILQEGKFWPARLNSTKLPDVYGVTMERQRGNRPIILPRDDILKEAVLEIRPRSVYQLPVGSRVCTVWSSAYICLFPGTIVSPDEPLPPDHVLVELDDGDSRLVEVDKIRMLPSDYSRVVYDPDPIATLRKRRISTDSHDSVASHGDLRAGYESARKCSKLAETSLPVEKKVRKMSGGEKVKKKHKKSHKHHGHHGHHGHHHGEHHGEHHCHKHKHKRHKSGENKRQLAVRSPHYVKSEHDSSDHSENIEQNEQSMEDSEHQNSSEDEREGERLARPHHDLANNKGRELWEWGGEGYKRPGGKGKSKKLFFKSIQRGRDVLHVNDCAVFLSTGRSDRPYIGKIEMLWETSQASMMCKVKWFYHPEEIETCGRKFDLKLPGGLFQSPHTDENSVHTISHKCEVLPIKEFSRVLSAEKKKSNTSYYLAGSYDPAGLSVHFQPGVLKTTGADDDSD